ncbi:MAG TPA: heme-binding domain-containing protein [Egicoccus sp.]|nr:heme-binding domain-containing protein [Egicoccus sp.]HSK22438.1 heme-binding domain-containing protein [Egicoccus sp.]
MDGPRRFVWVRRVLLVGLAVFVAIQFVPYGRDHTDPPVVQAAPWPNERAAEVFTQSCAACHSNETDWPWYSHVAPVSWLVYRDVVEGRDEMNFSRWDDDEGEADDAIEAIEDGSMPPLTYVLAHPSARLTDEETQILVDALRRMDE